MAKKVILKDNDNIEILPITRGELITDSSGNPAFHSKEFLATQSLPGLLSAEDKKKLDSTAGNSLDDVLNITSTNPVLNKVITKAIEDVTLLANNAQTSADSASLLAQKALQTADGIKNKYLKSAVVNGNNLTITDLSNSEINFYNTTYDTFLKDTSNGSGGRKGLVPKPSYNSGSTNRYLREDGAWIIPDNTNTTYTFKGDTNGFTVTSSDGSEEFINVIPNIANNVIYSGTLVNNQVAIFDGTSGKIKASGYTIASDVPLNAKFTDTTYSNGDGLSLSNYIFSLKKSDTDELGGIKIAKNNSNYTVVTRTSNLSLNITTVNQYYGVELDSTGKAFVYVPWLNTEYSLMTLTEANKGTEITARTISAKVLHDKIKSLLPSVMTGATSSSDGESGLVPKPIIGDLNKYLKGDGNWDTPLNDKVTLTNTTTSADYRVLFSENANDTTSTEGARKSSKLKFNPSTGTLTATTFNGNLDWTKITNKPSSFTPSTHYHPTSQINALTGYSKATEASDLIVTDTLNIALGKLEYKADAAYTFYKSIFGPDTDDIINKYDEIVDFIDSVKEGSDITDEFVTRKTTQTITGAKTFSKTITSTVTNDTAPFVITSTTKVTNLNVDMLDGYHESSFVKFTDRIDSSNTTTSVRHMGYGYSANGWKGSGPAISIGAVNGYIMQIQQLGEIVYVRHGEPNSFTNWKRLAYTADIDTANVAIANKVANKLILKIKSGTTEGTDLYTYDGSNTKTLNIKAGSNITLGTLAGILTISATNTNTTYTLSGALDGNTFVTSLTPSSGTGTKATIPAMVGATSSKAGEAGLVPAPGVGKDTSFLKGDGTWAIPLDTKVTSVDNHYTPEADLTKTLGATASSTTSATWGSTDLITGIKLLRDAKGHVTGITVDSTQLPSNPNVNTWRPVMVNGSEVATSTTGTGTLNLKSGAGITVSGTKVNDITITNAGVRSVTIGTGSDANKLAVNTDGNTTHLIIPYATLAAKVTCTASTDNIDRPIVLTNTSNNLYYSTKATINYSTGHIKVGALTSTGQITLYSSSGDSPHLYFLRGTTSDGTYDWDLYVTSGYMKFKYNNAGTYTEVLSLYPGNSTLDGYKILHAGNSSVSGNGGSTWGSSITVKINGVSKTLTIPANPLSSIKTLTFSAGTFAAKTYNGSADVTVNVPSNFNHIEDATNLYVNAGTVKRRIIVQNTKNSLGYISRASIGLSNPANQFSPVIIGVGTNDEGTTFTDYYFHSGGSITDSKGNTYAKTSQIPTIPSLSLGTTTGSGNAVTSITVSGHTITLNKGTTFSTSGHTHYYLVTPGDQRSTATTPNSYSNKFIFLGLKTNSTIGSPSSDTYSYLFGLRGWSDSSGGNSWELAFNNTGIYARNGATTSWGNWKKIVFTSDIPSVTVSTTGSGNAITSVSATGHSITFTKGTTFSVSGHSHSTLTFLSGAFSAKTYNGTAATTVNVPTIGAHIGLGNVLNTAFYKRSTSVNGTAWDMAGTVNSAAFTIFAPTTAGTSNYVLKSNGSGAPTWIALSSIAAGSAGYTYYLAASSISNLNTPNWKGSGISADTFNGSASNKPYSGNNANGVINFSFGKHNTSNYFGFLLALGNGSDRLYFRQATGGSSTTSSFTGWKTIAFTSDIPSISITNSGSGNAVTSITASGHTITVTKGSTFSLSGHTHSYVPLAGTTALTGSIEMKDVNTSIPFVRNFTSASTTGWARGALAIKVDGTSKFTIGAYGSYTAEGSSNGISYAYIGCNAWDGVNLRIASDSLKWGTNNILHAGNSSVSGGGSTWGSSITVNINGTSKTLTIPSNPNTDTKNTAGSTNTTSKLFLIGATSLAANPVTYSNSGVYTQSGNVYATHFYETSDITFKINIKPISDSDNIPILKEFNWKNDGTRGYGLIAQELEAMGYSELVSSEENGTKTVNYSAALSLIVGKLQVKIKELEKEIETLKNKN